MNCILVELSLEHFNLFIKWNLASVIDGIIRFTKELMRHCWNNRLGQDVNLVAVATPLSDHVLLVLALILPLRLIDSVLSWLLWAINLLALVSAVFISFLGIIFFFLLLRLLFRLGLFLTLVLVLLSGGFLLFSGSLITLSNKIIRLFFGNSGGFALPTLLLLLILIANLSRFGRMLRLLIKGRFLSVNIGSRGGVFYAVYLLKLGSGSLSRRVGLVSATGPLLLLLPFWGRNLGGFFLWLHFLLNDLLGDRRARFILLRLFDNRFFR